MSRKPDFENIIHPGAVGILITFGVMNASHSNFVLSLVAVISNLLGIILAIFLFGHQEVEKNQHKENTEIENNQEVRLEWFS